MKQLLLFSLINYFCGAMSAQTYIPVTNPDPNILSYTFQGGSIESYGCVGIDPTFWLENNGNSLTVNFVNLEQNPSVRVWGMNTDDTAQFMVNGVTYPLNSSTASYDSKVICNVIGSPGPDGVLFSGGLLVGSNTNSQGNYSFQNVTIISANITSITVTGLSGLGWGIGGITVDNPLASNSYNLKSKMEILPNPTSGKFTIDLGTEYTDVLVTISNIPGQVISSERYASAKTIENEIATSIGVYFVKISTAEGKSETFRIIKK